MTAAQLSAGDGYGYYLSETASGDVRRGAGQELGDYYLAGGTPAGVWVGSGTATLGVSGEVTESQMKSLFGIGLHPEAEARLPQMTAQGMSVDQAMKDLQLGRRYASFNTPSSELSQALTQAIAAAETAKGRVLDPGERRRVRMRTAAIAYREHMGKSPAGPEVLTRWMSVELRKGQQPVAGFDATFSAPKSVSVLWAAGDEDTRISVEQAHEAAIADALAYLEEHAITARTGAKGAQQVAVEGLVGTRFRHWTSREGDPQLHDHVVIANKVRRADMGAAAKDTDGWLTLDSRNFYRHVQAASSVYDRALVEHMRDAGYVMEDRAQSGTRKLHMEVKGISDETITEFSGRRRQIIARTQELVTEWEAAHLTTADTLTRQRLAQQATLETRKTKTHIEALDVVQAQARARLPQDLPGRSRWLALSRQTIDTSKAATGIVDDLSSRRAQWNEAHLETAINLWAARNGASKEDEQKVRHEVAQRVVSLTPQSSAPAIIRPAQTTRWYTSSAVLDAENIVLDASDQLVLPEVTVAQFDAAVAAHIGPLDEGQIALARTFATGEKLVEAGIGPAGAGKTTAMKLTVEAVEMSGHRVVGLSTNARAAEVFATETGAFATSLAMWTTQRNRPNPDSQYQLRRGDVIVVDEASMASTEHLAAVVQDAQKAGAFVRLLGDPAQLGAVESGGLLREIDRRHGAVRLESLWRFADVMEGAASTRLSAEGDVAWYEQNDRIHGVRPDRLNAQVMAEWFTHTQVGRQVAVMATTNAEVDALNTEGQKLMVDAGLVDHTRTVALRNGAVAGVGDTILTRAVDRKIRTHDGKSYVHNGDRWKVSAIGDDGSVVAASDTGRRVTLPANYLRNSTQLGYASTVHVAQGSTVDRGILVATEGTDRNALYVGLTRGREHNEVFVPLSGRTAHEVIAEAAARSTSSLSAHEVMAQEQAAVDDPAQAIRAFRVVVAETDRPRFDTHIRQTYASLYGAGRELEAATAADSLIGSESRAALDNALRRGEAAGFSVDRLLRAVAPEPIVGALDPGRVVAWRIDQHLARATEHAATSPTLGPLSSYTDVQLLALADQTDAAKRDAQAALREASRAVRLEPQPVTMKNGQTAPAWTDRPHGHLTRDELSAALDDAQAAVTETTAKVHDAAEALDGALATWREVNQAGQRLSPQTVAAAHDVEAAEHALAAAQETDRLARSEYVDLRAEQQTRRHMTGKSWAMETRSRDVAAARQDQPATRTVDPAEVVGHRYASHVELEHATDQLARARTIDAQVRAEQATRLLVPNMDAPWRRGLPTWSGASNALHDLTVPESRREDLAQAADWIQHRITTKGEEIALAPEKSPWSRELGPVPSTPSLRARWTYLAGRIATYRELTGYNQPDRSLPTASRRPSREATEIHTMRAAMSDLRIETRQTDQTRRYAQLLAQLDASHQPGRDTMMTTRRDQTMRDEAETEVVRDVEDVQHQAHDRTDYASLIEQLDAAEDRARAVNAEQPSQPTSRQWQEEEQRQQDEREQDQERDR